MHVVHSIRKRMSEAAVAAGSRKQGQATRLPCRSGRVGLRDSGVRKDEVRAPGRRGALRSGSRKELCECVNERPPAS